jgi:hypothetical protein
VLRAFKKEAAVGAGIDEIGPVQDLGIQKRSDFKIIYHNGKVEERIKGGLTASAPPTQKE